MSSRGILELKNQPEYLQGSLFNIIYCNRYQMISENYNIHFYGHVNYFLQKESLSPNSEEVNTFLFQIIQYS